MGCNCDKCEHCKNQQRQSENLTSYKKWKYTLITTVIFLIVVHPATYRLVDSLVGSWLCRVASKSGCPTMCGLLLHAVVFTLLLRYVMDFSI